MLLQVRGILKIRHKLYRNFTKSASLSIKQKPGDIFVSICATVGKPGIAKNISNAGFASYL